MFWQYIVKIQIFILTLKVWKFFVFDFETEQIYHDVKSYHSNT